jgi:hypothetical protein
MQDGVVTKSRISLREDVTLQLQLFVFEYVAIDTYLYIQRAACPWAYGTNSSTSTQYVIIENSSTKAYYELRASTCYVLEYLHLYVLVLYSSTYCPLSRQTFHVTI